VRYLSGRQGGGHRGGIDPNYHYFTSIRCGSVWRPTSTFWYLASVLTNDVVAFGVEFTMRTHSSPYATFPDEIRSSKAMRSEIGGCVSKR
jgi:hypothetical protein